MTMGTSDAKVHGARRNLLVDAVSDLPGLAVVHDSPEVAARNHPHAPVGHGDVIQRRPAGDQRHGLDREIGRILVVGLLDAPGRLHEELALEELHVGADQVLHHVQNGVVPGVAEKDGIVLGAMVQLANRLDGTAAVGRGFQLQIPLRKRDSSVGDVRRSLFQPLHRVRGDDVFHDQVALGSILSDLGFGQFIHVQKYSSPW